MTRLLSLIAILLFTVSCERASPPAEVKDYGAGGGSSLGVIQVYEGDNLYKLAQLYRVPLRDLIEENNLTPPYKLGRGQRLQIPAPRIYKAKAGDSYASIALLYDLSVTELVQQNNSPAPHTIVAGQDIYLSKSKKEARVQERKRQIASNNVVRKAPPKTRQQAQRQIPQPQAQRNQPQSQVQSQVFQDDMSQDPGTPLQTEQDRAAQRRASKNGVVQNEVVQNTAPSESPSQESSFNVQSYLDEQPVQQAAYQPPAPPSAQTIQQVKSKTKINTPPPRSGSKFSWPVKGKVLSRYGGKQGGLFNDGINIGVPEGTTVRAAENGVVAYVGHDLKGFGNLVLVKHEDGYMTAYAHLNKSLVERGTVLKKGQTLGTVGKTGSVSTPQIHFEVRKDGKPVDPSKYLI